LGPDCDPTEILAATWCVSWHLRRELLPGCGLRHIRGEQEPLWHRNDLAFLTGEVRFLTSSETSDGHGLDEGVVKRVTGQSPVTARHIRSKPITFLR
jgi:hypothetical protein